MSARCSYFVASDREIKLVETKRLLLRKPMCEDSDILEAILSSVSQTQYLPNEAPYNADQRARYLDNRISHWQAYGFGTFIVCLKENPRVKLGFVGAEHAPVPGYVDIRFGIVPEYEGCGFITEAASELVRWVFDNTGVTELYGAAMPANTASKSVLRKIGMARTGDIGMYDFKGLENYRLTLESL